MTRTAHPAHRAIRRKLLISCATLAIVAGGLTSQKARASTAPGGGAFQGTITSSTNATRTITGSNSETITITNPTATIDWSPYDNQTGTTAPIEFLPSGDTATFTIEVMRPDDARCCPTGRKAVRVDLR